MNNRKDRNDGFCGTTGELGGGVGVVGGVFGAESDLDPYLIAAKEFFWKIGIECFVGVDPVGHGVVQEQDPVFSVLRPPD